jgi:hypothetical protein
MRELGSPGNLPRIELLHQRSFLNIHSALLYVEEQHNRNKYLFLTSSYDLANKAPESSLKYVEG